MRTLMHAAALIAAAFPAFAQVAAPEGYRTQDYDAPVPAGVDGALTVSDETAYALWLTGKVTFIDVMPDFPRPEGLPKDAIWQGRVRYSAPGAVWMPEAGYGDLTPELAAAFKAELATVTGGDLEHPILFLCRQDCWMSWNASKRAAGWGYTRVFWYPDGSTGWEFWDWPMERMRRAKK